jgi:uncharacterized protein
MARLLVGVVLVVLAVWLLRRAQRAAERGAGREEAPQQPSATQGELVRCVQCGVHLPRAEARMSGGRLYCSDEHARLGPADGRKAG